MSSYHIEVLSKYPACEWIAPTNQSSNDFSVFADLYEVGLVERKIEYSYRGSEKVITGAKVWFRHSINNKSIQP